MLVDLRWLTLGIFLVSFFLCSGAAVARARGVRAEIYRNVYVAGVGIQALSFLMGLWIAGWAFLRWLA